MSSSINRELLKGSIELVLLALLERGPSYGYQIAKEIRQQSTDVIQLKDGSLYPALHRLEQAGLIEGYWQAREDGSNRRYYKITASGQEAVKERRAEWQRFTTAIDGVIRYA